MKAESLGKVWVALLLLCATLSSAPIGSMEQRTTLAFGQPGHAQSVPAMRPGDAPRLAEPTAGASRSDPSPATPPLPADLHIRLVLRLPPDCTLRSPRSPDRRPTRPLCERLPYHANAPPPAA